MLNFRATVYPLNKEGSSLKAFADVTVAESFDDKGQAVGMACVIKDIGIVEGKNGLFVRMPSSTYTDKQGETKRKDIVIPLTKETREAIEDACIVAYTEAV